MSFINIRFTEEQAREVGKQLGKQKIPEGIMVITDGSQETVQETLKFIDTVQDSVSMIDLLEKALEGKLIGSAVMW